MHVYRGPAWIGLAVASLTFLGQFGRYGLDEATVIGSALNGAVVYAVASVVLLAWRAVRRRPLR